MTAIGTTTGTTVGSKQAVGLMALNSMRCASLTLLVYVNICILSIESREVVSSGLENLQALYSWILCCWGEGEIM